jgi:hypothetical protein
MKTNRHQGVVLMSCVICFIAGMIAALYEEKLSGKTADH